MMDKKNIFTEDIEIPEIVMQKAEDAFAQIRLEGKDIMKEKNEVDILKKQGKRRKIFKHWAAAAACLGIVAASSISTVAAIHHYWGRGMQSMLQASDAQQQKLTEQGIAAVMAEDDYDAMAVTVGNVTVKPDTIIVDEKFAYVSFSVDGYILEEGEEPCFEFINGFLGDDPDAEEGALNMSGIFYDGIVRDESGSLVYDDGSPLSYGDNGDFLAHYTDENGTLEYVMMFFSPDPDKSLLGQTLHVELENLGTAYKAGYTGALEGEWNFEISLSDESAATNLSVGTAVEDTAFQVDSIELSPVSIKINYSVNGEVNVSNDENGVPEFCGVVLKDGTRLPYLGNGGMSGYTDENRTGAYALSAFNQVIDPEQVEALLLKLETGTDYYTVELENK